MAKLQDNLLVWAGLEGAVMFASAQAMSTLIDVAGIEAVGAYLPPTTILLSVALGVSVQLWSKLNDLSSLVALASNERNKLFAQVRRRVRSLVFLITFFVAFIFAVLVSAVLATSTSIMAQPLMIGIGAGLGASLMLITGLLVDLNEVAEYRWHIEGKDQETKRRESVIARLEKQEEGFEGDEHLKGYKRVAKRR